MLIAKFKSLTQSKRPVEKTRVRDADLVNSPLLRLPKKVRMRIYTFAFTRTTVERLQELQLGSHLNDASGLLLTCHLIYTEVNDFAKADSVISLWPWFSHEAMSYDAKTLQKNPIMKEWQQSRHSIALKHRPQNIRHLAWQILLVRNASKVCEHLVKSPIFAAGTIYPTDLYVRVCICDALAWLGENPSQTTSFCAALESVAIAFPTLKCINVYFCGRTWPAWLARSGQEIDFAGIIYDRHQTLTSSGSPWSVYRRSPELMSDDDMCRLSTEMSWNTIPKDDQTQAIPRHERVVRIDYYDSWRVCKERCVRNKPSRNAVKGTVVLCCTTDLADTSTEKTKPVITKVVSSKSEKQKSTLSKTTSKVKSVLGVDDFEFRRPLVPRWPPDDGPSRRHQLGESR
jgi:hypothetical protein